MRARSGDDPEVARNATNQSQEDETRYAEPFGWWGYHWAPPEPRSLPWLVQTGSLDLHLAAFLSLAVELRRTLVVIATPQEAGKTTLLTALLDFLPEDVQPIYLRGWYERFTFLETTPPERAYLLCNEISAHLPTYLWGQGVRRVFHAGMEGYPFVTTMHASSAAEAVDLLRRYPLEVPAEHIPAIDLIASLDVGYVGTRLVRRVMKLEVVTADEQPYRIETLSERTLLRSDLEHRTGRMIALIGRWARSSDDEAGRMLIRRERMLQALIDAGTVEVEAVRREIAATRRR